MSAPVAVYLTTAAGEHIFIGYDDEPQVTTLLVQFRRPTESIECRFCGMCHESGTACPPLELPGTESDQ